MHLLVHFYGLLVLTTLIENLAWTNMNLGWRFQSVLLSDSLANRWICHHFLWEVHRQLSYLVLDLFHFDVYQFQFLCLLLVVCGCSYGLVQDNA